MNYRHLAELENSLDHWWKTLRDDSARLRRSQRHLLECRQLSPRPRASVALTLRMCAAARKQNNQAAACVADLRRRINQLSGTASQ